MNADEVEAAIGRQVEVDSDDGEQFTATIDSLDPAYPERDVVWVRDESGIYPMRPEQLRLLAATPTPGETEGRAGNGDEPVTAGLLRGMAADLDRAAFATRSAGMQAIKVVAADLRSLADLVPNPQPSAPADDTARVLTGLREEMTMLCRKSLGFDNGLYYREGVRDVVKLLEAAQQRLADRGQSRGSDEQ